MVKRSQPMESDGSGNHSVALWRDTIFGDRELTLHGKQDAGVLSLVCKTREEFTADGRSDKRQAYFPVYSGWHPFESDAGEPAEEEPSLPKDERTRRYRFTTEVDHGFPVLIAMMRLKDSRLARKAGKQWVDGVLHQMKSQLNPEDREDVALAQAIIEGNELGSQVDSVARQRYRLLRSLAGIKSRGSIKSRKTRSNHKGHNRKSGS
jgi:hypothetical protein